MALWEQVLLGIGALILLQMFWPSARGALRRTRGAQERKWSALLVPLAFVIVFVALLVLVARS